MRINSREGLVKLKMRWRVVDPRRCFLANLGSEMREFQDLQTQRSCKSDLTGSLHRISTTSSNGRVGGGGGGGTWTETLWGSEEEEGEGDVDVDVRVPVEVVNRCLLVVVPSSVGDGAWDEAASFCSSPSLAGAMFWILIAVAGSTMNECNTS